MEKPEPWALTFSYLLENLMEMYKELLFLKVLLTNCILCSSAEMTCNSLSQFFPWRKVLLLRRSFDPKIGIMIIFLMVSSGSLYVRRWWSLPWLTDITHGMDSSLAALGLFQAFGANQRDLRRCGEGKNPFSSNNLSSKFRGVSWVIWTCNRIRFLGDLRSLKSLEKSLCVCWSSELSCVWGVLSS